MSQETGGAGERLSPAEKARKLAAKAKEQLAREEAERQAEKVGRLREIESKIKETREALADQRRELKEVQDGLNEIADVEKDGVMSDELLELRGQLEADKEAIAGRVRELEEAARTLESDPLHAEMAEATRVVEEEQAQAAAAAEAERAQREKKEMLESGMRRLETAISKLETALQVAQQRETDIRSLRAEQEQLVKQLNQLAKTVETDIGGVLYAIPEKQQRAIEQAVREARTDQPIHSASGFSGDNGIVYRPSATTMSTWFEAWRKRVTPSLLPFTDRPLRALIAFSEDPRIAAVEEQQGKISKLTEQVDALFADRKATNTKFAESLLAPDSKIMGLDFATLRDLRYSDGIDKKKLREDLLRLAECRKKLDFLLTDVDTELYNQIKKSDLVTENAISSLLY